MNERLLLASRRTEYLVSRSDELTKVRQAIYHPKASLEILFLYGPGGLGKSRLIEEVMWRAGNPLAREIRGEIPSDKKSWDWSHDDEVAIADLLDMVDINLHTRTEFMHAVRNGLVRAKPGLNFSEYDIAFKKLQNRLVQEGGFATIHQAIQEAETKFIKCFQQSARGTRLVVTLDTAEKLAYSHSQWLIDKDLIRTDELTFNTTQWLCRQISSGAFSNTTLVLVGRKEEGKEFFRLIAEAVETARSGGKSVELDRLELQPFKLHETQEYFSQLSESWKDEALANDHYQGIATTFDRLAKNPARIEVLWRYTGGQPVRLALYADLIVEGIDIPAPLLHSPTVAKVKAEQELPSIQKEIEGHFFALFSRPTLRARILQALVRAPRGLNAQQLTYGLFEKGHEHTEDAIKLNPAALADVENELATIRNLTIVKVRPVRQFINTKNDDNEEEEVNELRLGLQDEIYHIYTSQMVIDPQARIDEQKARKRLYNRLYQWAVDQRKQNEKLRKAFQTEDERKLVFQGPAHARSVSFPLLADREQIRRNAIRQNIQAWQQEELHYDLQVDLRKSLNEIAFELGYADFKSCDEEGDALHIEEIYQVIHDENSLAFMDIPRWPTLHDDEDPLPALVRFARQTEMIRWLQRFVLRQQYDRVIEFYRAIDENMHLFSKAEQRSWSHTFARGERLLWREYANMLQSHNYEAATQALEGMVFELEKLAKASSSELVFSDRGEHGFVGHAAHGRLVKVIALAYNWIGYGHTQLGHLDQGVKNYAQALRYMRETEFRVQMATTLNNLSRALSDKGRGRARRVCLDGLKLRKEQGAEVPIAFSMNTLALIDNDQLRPDLAWEEAATALAYFERADDQRGMGLSLLQLGEALRRLAAQERTGRVLPEPPEFILDEAEVVLDEAVGIFTNGPASAEVIRLVEAHIEMGCLLRDQLNFQKVKSQRRQTYSDALNHFQQASDLAKQHGWYKLQLDANVNSAWTHFVLATTYYRQEDPEPAEELLNKAEAKLNEIKKTLPKKSLIMKRFLPRPQRDDSYVYQQLSKIYGLYGRIEMDRFRRRINHLEKGRENDEREKRWEIGHNDVTAQKHLSRAAEQYILGLAYAQLFSPRSSALSALYDALYDYLKQFNPTELSDFYLYEKAHRDYYRTGQLKMEDLGDLGEFLKECFGSFGGE